MKLDATKLGELLEKLGACEAANSTGEEVAEALRDVTAVSRLQVPGLKVALKPLAEASLRPP